MNLKRREYPYVANWDFYGIRNDQTLWRAVEEENGGIG